MPNQQKVDYYSEPDYSVLERKILLLLETMKYFVKRSVKNSYQLGFSYVQTEAPLMKALAVRGNVNMYLSLITDMLMLLLVYFSSSLLFSLSKIIVRINYCVIV